MFEGTDAVSWTKQADVMVVRFAKPKVIEESYVRQTDVELRRIVLRAGRNILFDLSNVVFLGSNALSLLIAISWRMNCAGLTRQNGLRSRRLLPGWVHRQLRWTWFMIWPVWRSAVVSALT